MITTLATLAFLLQAAPPAPRPPHVMVPRVKVKAAPHARRWSDEDTDRTRDTSFAVRQGQRLSVNNFGGSITVSASNDDRVRISAASSDDAFQVDVGSVTIEVETSGGHYGGPGDADLRISAPAWMELELSGTEVDINASGMRGPITASTVEGGVEIAGADGSVEATSVEGDITISNARGQVEVNTVEGRVSLTNISGPSLSAESVDGDIEMSGVQSTTVTVNTVDGDISWRGAFQANGTYKFSTHDGDLELLLPSDPDVTVSVETYDGSIESDWPITLTRGGSTHRTTFTLGSGRTRLELSSFDGTISLKRGGSR